MRPPIIVGASHEVLSHHAAQHPCEDHGSTVLNCPCGSTAAILCDACGLPLFLSVEPGTWCEHAERFMRERGERR
jgi:hypothetical protein